MPRYDYSCPNCKEVFEVEQSIKADKGAECPHCNTFSAERLISNTAFSLKGSGWAADNYSSSKKSD